MDSIQDIDPDLEILVILDSPQLDGLAPELAPYRDRVQEAAAKIASASCSSCARRKTHRILQRIAAEMTKKIYASPALHRVLDALFTTAAQVTQEGVKA